MANIYGKLNAVFVIVMVFSATAQITAGKTLNTLHKEDILSRGYDGAYWAKYPDEMRQTTSATSPSYKLISKKKYNPVVDLSLAVKIKVSETDFKKWDCNNTWGFGGPGIGYAGVYFNAGFRSGEYGLYAACIGNTAEPKEIRIYGSINEDTSYKKLFKLQGYKIRWTGNKAYFYIDEGNGYQLKAEFKTEVPDCSLPVYFRSDNLKVQVKEMSLCSVQSEEPDDDPYSYIPPAVLKKVNAIKTPSGLNMIVNSGFESRFDNWKPSGDKKAMSFEPGRNGGNSLSLSNDGALQSSSSVKQRVYVKMNTVYKMSAWIKTENLKIKEGSTLKKNIAKHYGQVGVNVALKGWTDWKEAGIEIEGRWALAFNPLFPDFGTTGWKYYERKITTDRYSYILDISNTICKDVTGKIWIDNISLTEIGPVPKKSLGPRVKELEKPFSEQWKFESNSNDNLLVDGKPFFPIGIYTCIGLDAASGTKHRFTGPFTPEVTRKRLKGIKDAGFNCFQSYTYNYYGSKVTPGWEDIGGKTPLEPSNLDTRIDGALKLLDYAQETGLMFVPMPWMKSSLYASSAAWKGSVFQEEWLNNDLPVYSNIINALKNHPAVLAWYLYDEPGVAKSQTTGLALRLCYRDFKKYDTVHPFIGTINPNRYAYSGRNVEAQDILSIELYPFVASGPHKQFTSIIPYLRSLRNRQIGYPPRPQAWVTPQITGAWFGDEYLPSENEMRAMFALLLTADVKGLLSYAYSNYPETNPTHWQRISNAVNSLKSVMPALLSEDVITGYKIDNKKIFSIMRQVTTSSGRKDNYLIAVNPHYGKPMKAGGIDLGKVTFDYLVLDENSIVTAMDEDENGNFSLGKSRQINLVKKPDGTYSFSDQFGKMATHMYKIAVQEKQ